MRRDTAFSLSTIGGTGVATPTIADIKADAQQEAGHALGFADPVIYQRYRTDAFHDVTDMPFGSNYISLVRKCYSDPCTQGSFALHAITGHDDATDVGSPQDYIQSFANHHGPRG